MTQLIAYSCDQIMDVHGSTCPATRLIDAPTVDAARVIATQAGWTLGGSTGRDLCPKHSGRRLRLQLPPVESIRRPAQVETDRPDNVIPMRPRN